ncbi:cytochrome P450 / NADPH-cytochrome P450 reductase [Rhizobium sp. NFR07]|uniref:bifunctional cytochrome P450/NADPH--P450 reductase n=1 Tax=Rhizobium sp. NFR07 TaxID=1566262 RepID=UPI0008DFEFA8|nr:cytochrome P450 [Rhizobium sp. NFR07]SFB61658.1 cytochrome P450 / NADPH-cytochrome P450 reductase [Rhizobium sp. NFR07]
MSEIIPKAKGLPLIGNIADIDPDAPVQSLMRMAERNGTLFRMEALGNSMIIVGSQALTDELCDETRFQKALHRPLQEARTVAGDGLFTAHDEEPNWGKAHRLLMPAFGPLGLRTMYERMLDIAEQLMVRWERFGDGATIDVADNMTRLTLDTIALCAFDYRFNSFYQNEMHPFVAAMVGGLEESGRRARLPAGVGKLNLLRARRFEADTGILRDVADRLIEERVRDPRLGEHGDLLDRMLTAKDPETGETLSRENIGYQMITFLVAGHETTSGLLSFATWLLLSNPDTLAKARAHVDEILGGATPTVDDIGRLTYIEQVLQETLRLWPTAPAFAVHAREATTIGGGRYAVTPDDLLLILTPVVHRDPDVWENPYDFRPERFAPEVASKLPPNAWKPFGNGQRSCIGRGFAMQEAVMVMALMLQRFDISFADRDYKLAVKETLTLKPADLHIHARRRDVPAHPVRSRVPSAPTRPLSAPQPTALVGANGPLLVLYGSNTGTCEAFAQRIAADAGTQGYVATAAAMDDYAAGLPKNGPVIIVTASYEGRPPDNAARFVSWLEALPEGELKGLPYAVFGCGNRQWARTYQAIPKRVDAALAAAGATALLPRGEGDAAGDLFGQLEGWYEKVWPALAASEGREIEAPVQPVLDVEVRRGSREQVLKLEELKRGTVLVNRELVDMSKPGARSKRHIEIALPEGMSYRAGDYLAVLPSNPPETVKRALTRFRLAPDAELIVHGAPGVGSALPVNRPVTAETLFADYLELQQPATRGQIAALAAAIPCPPERREAERLAEVDIHAVEVLERRVTLLDLLERFGSADLPLGAFIAAMPPMRARQYSIASSPLADPSRCALTVSVLEVPAFGADRLYRGVASTFLAGLREGDTLGVAVRQSQAGFHPPDDPRVPIIMVCAGSGIAPFRGFIQERAMRRAAGETIGSALLFFGVHAPDMDFLHREELERWEAEGVVSCRMAVSDRSKDGITYVQDAIWHDRAAVAELFRRGAHVYVCGDGIHMAPAARETFVRIYQEAMGVTRDLADAWASEVERQAVRYVADVFS